MIKYTNGRHHSSGKWRRSSGSSKLTYASFGNISDEVQTAWKVECVVFNSYSVIAGVVVVYECCLQRAFDTQTEGLEVQQQFTMV